MQRARRRWERLEPADGRGWGERFGITRALERRYLRWGSKWWSRSREHASPPGVVIAIRDAQGELVGIKWRRPGDSWGVGVVSASVDARDYDQGGKRDAKYMAQGEALNRQVFLLEEAQRFPGATVVIVGGEKDALVAASHLDPERWAAVSACTGEGSTRTCLATLVEHVGTSRPIVVALDGDKAGREGTEKAVKELHRLGVAAPRVAQLPEGMDATDVLMVNGAEALDQLLAGAEQRRRAGQQEGGDTVADPLDDWEEDRGRVVRWAPKAGGGRHGRVMFDGIPRVEASEVIWHETPEDGWVQRKRLVLVAQLRDGREIRHAGEGLEAFKHLLELAAGANRCMTSTEKGFLFEWASRRAPRARIVRLAAGYCGEAVGWLFAPGVRVHGGKVTKHHHEVAAPGPNDLARYRLAILSPERLREVAAFVASKLIPCDHADRAFTLPILAGVLVGPVWTHVKEVANWQRYSFFLQGSSGVGKSQLLRYFMSLWGDFTSPEGLSTWASTTTFLEEIAYRTPGVPFYVGDWKPANFGGKRGADQARRFLQAYGDRSARGRANSSAELRTRKEPRCQLVIDGEDLPEGEQSTLGRMVSLRVEGSSNGLCATAHEGVLPPELVVDLPGLCAEWIAWVQRHARTIGGWIPEIAAQVDAAVPDELGQTNRRRILRNHTLQLLTLRGFCAFLDELGQFCEPHYTRALEVILAQAGDQVASVSEEAAGDTWLSTLKALLMSGEVHLEPEERGPGPDSSGVYPFHEPKHSSTRVGTYHQEVAYLWPRAADPAVKRRCPELQFSRRAILQQLKESGVVERRQRRIPGGRVWAWAVHLDALAGEELDDEDAEADEVAQAAGSAR